MNIDKNGNWKLYWGAMPRPAGAESVGIIERTAGDRGALILLSAGIYAQGNAGSLRSLDQYEIKKELGVPIRGGKRPGAGRPATGRKKRFLQATDEEWALILKYADEVRGK